jgi:hypothetical protein
MAYPLLGVIDIGHIDIVASSYGLGGFNAHNALPLPAGWKRWPRSAISQ